MKENYTVRYTTPADNREAREKARMLEECGATGISMDSRETIATWLNEEQERRFIMACESEVLKDLIHHTDQMITLLQEAEMFVESAETGMLRTLLVALVGKLQERGVLPHNFHVNDGVAVWHLPESPYDQE